MGIRIAKQDRTAALKIDGPSAEESEGGSAVELLISGYPAEIRVWTPEQWAFPGPPRVGAHLLPNGLWVDLRIA